MATEPAQPTVEDGAPRRRGINHLALVTNDMDTTVRFYHGVLGARLVADLAAPGQFRHYFFELGAENTIAFFEYTNHPVEAFAKPAADAGPMGGAVRSCVVQPARRSRIAGAAQSAQGGRQRGHRRRRPWVPAVRGSPIPTGSRTRRRVGWSIQPADPPMMRTRASFRTPTLSRRSSSCGQAAALPPSRRPTSPSR